MPILWASMVRLYKSLEKLAPLPIKAICLLHGPVWIDQIEKVIGIYDKLSRYEGEEGVVIVYGTMYGNTEQMAEAIALSSLHKA